MNNKDLLKKIDYLYEKYNVDKSFYSFMTEKEKILGIKGILAELDLKKNKNYEKKDIDTIKDIYSLYC